MTSKIGRNDICSCGSGKKYKKCCISQAESNTEAIDFEWRRLRKAEGNIVDNHLIPYVIKKFPKEMIREVFDEFSPDCFLEEEENFQQLFNCFFIPWLLFNWVSGDDFGLKHFEAEQTIAQNYLRNYKDKLSYEEKQFLEGMNETYYSFYTVLEVDFEKSLVVKDLLLGSTHLLKERQGTHCLKRGDVVFSRIFTLGEQSIFIGMAPFVIPTYYQHDLIDFRKWLTEENDNKPLTGRLLREEFMDELLDYFFEILEEIFNKPAPTLLNTDDELIQFSKSYFKLNMPPEEAFKILLPLTLSKNPTEFLQDAKHDKSGKMKSIEFPWLKKGNKKHKGWDNTVTGHIKINSNKLILETNSVNRSKKGQALLNKYLGEGIYFERTIIESFEKKLKESKKKESHKQLPMDLQELPEIQEKIKQMAEMHWENWFDMPIPALKNKSPRESAKTKDGKELLEALLLQYERYDLERDENSQAFKADINYLRSKLKLNR